MEGQGNTPLCMKSRPYLDATESDEAVVSAECSRLPKGDIKLRATSNSEVWHNALLDIPPISPPQAALGPDRQGVGVSRKSDGKYKPWR